MPSSASDFPCLVSETHERQVKFTVRKQAGAMFDEIAVSVALFFYLLLPDPCKFRAKKQYSVKGFQLSSKHPCISFPSFPFFFEGILWKGLHFIENEAETLKLFIRPL